MRGRGQAEQNAGKGGDGEREQQHGGVDANVGGARQDALVQGVDGIGRQVREAEAERAAGDREHETLDQELAQQPGAGGPEREPHRNLALTERRARQQQVGQVGAGDQQDEADRAEQHQHAAPRVADHYLAQLGRRDRGAVVDRFRGHDRVGDGGQVGGGVGGRRAGPQPPEHAQEVVAVRVHVIAGLERHRHEELRVDADEREASAAGCPRSREGSALTAMVRPIAAGSPA